MQYERGCLPCTNCIIAVPQDRYFAAERFGSFYNLYGPGLSCVGLDLCGMCISLRSLTSRVEQLFVQVPTKTQDNVFVEIGVAVQFSVKPDGAQDAFYKLSDVGAQIDSYVSDVVRSQIPKITLDQTFEAKDKLSSAIMEDLTSHMDGFGFQIHKALVTDVAVGQEVMRSMNEINKQKRLRDASVMAAEAEKIRTVTAAEADADAAHLAGEGIARQRAVIVQGLRDSIATTGRELKQGDIIELLLATQYFETLKEIGSHENCKAYFLPETKNDPDAQVRSGFLQGQTALEYLSGVPGAGSRPPPRQQQMSRPATSPPPAASPPPAYQAPYSPGQPSSPPPPARRAPTVLQVQVPAGVQPGQQLQIQAPDGRVVQVSVPPGVAPGATIQVQV